MSEEQVIVELKAKDQAAEKAAMRFIAGLSIDLRETEKNIIWNAFIAGWHRRGAWDIQEDM